MVHQISISQARAQLSQLLKQLQEAPDTVFQITVNGLVLGELRSPQSDWQLTQPGQALSQAMAQLGEPEAQNPGNVARQHDDVLYAKRSG